MGGGPAPPEPGLGARGSAQVRCPPGRKQRAGGAAPCRRCWAVERGCGALLPPFLLLLLLLHLPPAGSMSPAFLLLLLLLLPARARRERLPGGAPAGRSAPAPSSSSTFSSSSSTSSSSSWAAGPSRFPRSRPGRRRGRLYCRVGIGFHLQLHPDGRVDGAHDASPLSILEIFAVSQGIVGIRGVFSNKFLAMSKKGKLHASARFTSECQFRERFQENSYNTYASAVHRGRRSGREWYVALNKRGKAKRGCSPRARPQHVSTHFLPRFRQPPPPQLAFTVTRPEKKPPPPPPPPPPKKMAAATPPRQSHGPVKYRLKFRFG
ncbi:fibroblast growth factor 5 [Anser cygnoides]|uniref:Fibroblast growth factor n=1 Tax=Anser cygnoides TaxID=8845 RepID=A0A8B9ECA7_ANSCY|nr:fibroblast growth factor 5 [Anser cygnoides]